MVKTKEEVAHVPNPLVVDDPIPDGAGAAEDISHEIKAKGLRAYVSGLYLLDWSHAVYLRFKEDMNPPILQSVG